MQNLFHFKGRCQFAKDSIYPVLKIQQFSGHLRQPLLRITERMRESGIYQMYRDFKKYADYYRVNVRQERWEYAQEKKELPFAMLDPKMFSIFLGLLILLGISFLVLVIEISYLVMGKLKSQLGTVREILHRCMKFVNTWLLNLITVQSFPSTRFCKAVKICTA